MSTSRLEQLKQELEYCIREELYEKATDLQTEIERLEKNIQLLKKNNNIAMKNNKNKRFVDFINEKETKP